MKKNFFCLLACFFCLLKISSDAEEPIVVRLATDTQRIPVYLVSLVGHASSLADELKDVLNFDFDHNGMTFVIPPTPAKDLIALSSNLEAPPSDWKALGAFYLVKVHFHDQKLSAHLFSANSDLIKHVDDIPLVGDLSVDRRRIHELADILFKGLFGREGIATTHILFTRKVPAGNQWVSEVWEADYDGANARQLTFDSGYAVTPVYVPPQPGYVSGSFFFVSYKTGQPKIYYQQLKGKESRRLTYLRGNQLMPTLSSKRDRVAFISDVTGNPDLFIQPFDPEAGLREKPYQIFAAPHATQGTPSFSPDGTRLVFVSNKDGSPKIYMMDVPRPGQSLKEIKARLVSKSNKESTAPAWSPDGTKVAYCSLTKGVRQIWVYDLEKEEARQLTEGPGNKENPTWAPDSLHLIFNSSDAGACELYLINLNQPEAARIRSGAGEKRFPAWEPR
jgi:TolB protein